MAKFITGQEMVIGRLESVKPVIIVEVATAVEQTAVDVINTAKKDHPVINERVALKAFHATSGRFASHTMTLVQGMFSDLTRMDDQVVEAQAYSVTKYAPDVELGTAKSAPYPFLWPAAIKHQASFLGRLKKALS